MPSDVIQRVGRPAPLGRLGLSIVYTTARAEPRIDWLLDGLESQAQPGDRVELVVVDLLGRAAEELGCRPSRCVRRVVVTRPKPSPWQGPGRVTPVDFWAAASARNTGLVLCSHDYVALLDDRCRLGPRWIDQVRDGHRARSSVLAGAYDKLDDPRPEYDHRAALYPSGRPGCPGDWLYSGNFCAPLPWLLEVNGFEEGMDGVAGEDCVLGLMLANAGRRIDFVPAMYVAKERPADTGHQLARLDEGSGPDGRIRRALERFGQRSRTEFTPDLAKLRRDVQAGRGFPPVDPGILDWYTQHPIRDVAREARQPTRPPDVTSSPG